MKAQNWISIIKLKNFRLFLKIGDKYYSLIWKSIWQLRFVAFRFFLHDYKYINYAVFNIYWWVSDLKLYKPVGWRKLSVVNGLLNREEHFSFLIYYLDFCKSTNKSLLTWLILIFLNLKLWIVKFQRFSIIFVLVI